MKVLNANKQKSSLGRMNNSEQKKTLLIRRIIWFLFYILVKSQFCSQCGWQVLKRENQWHEIKHQTNDTTVMRYGHTTESLNCETLLHQKYILAWIRAHKDIGDNDCTAFSQVIFIINHTWHSNMHGLAPWSLLLLSYQCNDTSSGCKLVMIMGDIDSPLPLFKANAICTRRMALPYIEPKWMFLLLFCRWINCQIIPVGEETSCQIESDSSVCFPHNRLNK